MSAVESFFERQVRYRTIRPQIIIALLAGATFSLDMLAAYTTMGDALQIYGGITLLLTFMYILVPPVFWVLAVSAIYVLGRALGAHMQYGVLLRVTGWGLIPFVGTGACIAAGRYLVLRYTFPCTETFQLRCDPSYYATIQDQVNHIYDFLAFASSRSTFQLMFALGMGLLLVTGYFWIVATEESSTLTKAGATLVVSVPVLLFGLTLTYVTFF